MTEGKDSLRDVDLTTLKGGAAIELWQREFARVLENIEDPNTEATEEREITLKITFKPEDDREVNGCKILCKANKLAGPRAIGTTVHIGRRYGALVAVEYDPNQGDIFDPEAGADVTPISAVREKEAGSD